MKTFRRFLGGAFLASTLMHSATAATTNLAAVADTFINSGTATLAYSGNNAGGSGWFDAGADGQGGKRRGLIRFDLSSLPSGATINSATLKLTVAKATMTAPVESMFELRKVMAAWGEGNQIGNNGAPALSGESSWIDRLKGTAAWTEPGGQADVSANVSAAANGGTAVNTVVNWSGPGLVADLQSWLANPSQNFGWMLISQLESTPYTVRGFYSSESSVSPPALEIDYTVPITIITNPIVERIPKGNLTVELQTVAAGMASPVAMPWPDDGSGRFFIADQNGKVWVINSGSMLPAPLLDVSDRLVVLGAYDERGLLGLAVHPNFAQNQLLYTYTSETNIGGADFQTGLGTANNHQSVITEWKVSAGNSNQVDLSSRRELLRIDEPQSNHNGGAMHFGKDGFLYVSLGDGGAANDSGAGHVTGGNAQDLNVILGKLLRIDVNGTNSANGKYGIPASNPFVGVAGHDEIYAYGLRNPFTFSFDRATGDLYLPDVGQNKVEEVNVITAGGNYGWNLREGSFWFDASTGNTVSAPVRTPPAGMIDPIAEYDHDDGAAVIGGYVYRGSAIPSLAGRYVFGDWGSFTFPSGRLFYLDDAKAIRELRIGLDDRPLGLWLKGFGEGPNGEIYVLGNRWLGPSGNTGVLLKIVPAPAPIGSGIALSGTNAALSWTGGEGPFSVQSRQNLEEINWTDTVITNDRAATLSRERQGFFRIKDVANDPAIPFTAYLTGAAERPTPSGSPATGTGIFSLDGNVLTFNIQYNGLLGTANNVHIHGPAPASLPAGVLVNLAPFNGGGWGTNGTLSGVVLLTDSQRALLMAGKTYVNVHSTTFGGGEIRGQIVPVNMQVELSGTSEVPPLNVPGRGLGNLTLVGNQLTMNVTYEGLTGPATGVHIHGPASSGSNATVMVNLAPLATGGLGASGSLSGSVTLNPDQLAALIDGMTYINFHTMANGAGEIRGQIVPRPSGVPLTAILSGAAERPPSTTTGSGNGTFSLDGDTLTFNLVYSGLTDPAIGAHIHGPTGTSTNAPVLINLAPFNGGAFGSSGRLAGAVKLTAAQRNYLLAGQTYVNLHTPTFGNGEIRGQIAPVLMSAGLSGYNERPTPAATPAKGSGTFALVRDQLAMNVTYTGLLSSAIASHIHGPAGFLASAGVLVDLAPLNGGSFARSGALFGTVTLNTTNLLSVIDGQTYVNLHTTNYTGGEIRGHIMR